MIVIIDYGMGNLRSVQKAFERISTPAKISSDIDEIINAEKIILPGVGHFEKGMENLEKRGFLQALNYAVKEKQIPILGICLGMQLLTEFSEEGNVNGFGWIKAKTTKFRFEKSSLKIPHMGWNTIQIKGNNQLYRHINQNSFFYFVHSYSIKCENEEDIIAETNYGINFVSSFNKDNIYGCQFHPEKSHDAGLLVLNNFAAVTHPELINK